MPLPVLNLKYSPSLARWITEGSWAQQCPEHAPGLAYPDTADAAVRKNPISVQNRTIFVSDKIYRGVENQMLDVFVFAGQC